MNINDLNLSNFFVSFEPDHVLDVLQLPLLRRCWRRLEGRPGVKSGSTGRGVGEGGPSCDGPPRWGAWWRRAASTCDVGQVSMAPKLPDGSHACCHRGPCLTVLRARLPSTPARRLAGGGTRRAGVVRLTSVFRLALSARRAASRRSGPRCARRTAWRPGGGGSVTAREGSKLTQVARLLLRTS